MRAVGAFPIGMGSTGTPVGLQVSAFLLCTVQEIRLTRFLSSMKTSQLQPCSAYCCLYRHAA